ncbi:hypothetical protein VPH35_040083 [Triticum aestivum]|uniref:RNase III domain-containing protein n=2 Tax=Triticum aestivum TaxID=4565 RepID=A0A3B6DK74_WHEAT
MSGPAPAGTPERWLVRRRKRRRYRALSSTLSTSRPTDTQAPRPAWRRKRRCRLVRRRRRGAKPPDAIAAVEAILGYTFADKALVEAALTHGSFHAGSRAGGAGATYERLEFLGDRAINVVVASHLYSAHPALRPGALTRLHSLNVDREKLARAAVAHGLHRFLRHETPFLGQHADDFAAEIAAYPVHSNGQVRAPKCLSDMVEALIGAVFLDSGDDNEQVWRVFRRLADPLIGPEMVGKQPMMEFNELCQGKMLQARIVKKDWAKSHTVKVVVAGETVAVATYGKNKHAARNRAVKSALDIIKARKKDSMVTLTSAPHDKDGMSVGGDHCPPKTPDLLSAMSNGCN